MSINTIKNSISLNRSGMKIKLSSKRLNSGRCQVRFQVAEETTGHSWYGYTLVDPKDTLKSVVSRIENTFTHADNTMLGRASIYNLISSNYRKENMMIFRDN
jgi:hypothetical protein